MTPQDALPLLEGSNYRGHVPVNWFQRGLLTVGSAVMGLVDTHRHGEPLPSSIRKRSLLILTWLLHC